MPGLLWQDIGDIDYIYNHIGINNCNQLINKAHVTTLNVSYSDFFYGLLYPTLINQPISIANYLAKTYNLQQQHQYFMLVEPTHLRLDRDRLIICEPQLLQLSISEQKLIVEQLNQHFAPDLQFYCISKDLWLLGHNNIRLTHHHSPALLDIIGENVDNFLPKDTQHLDYTSVLNEIQMVLHNYANRHKNKSTTQPHLNSVWLWDKYIQLPQDFYATLDQQLIYTTNSTLVADNNLNIAALSGNFALTQQHNTLLVDTLYYASRYRDTNAYINTLKLVDQQIAQILTDRVYAHMTNIKIYVPGINNTLLLSLNRFSRYNIWRNHTLQKLAKGYA